jgi:uncharacterized repeat protein (TIGR01451 family)
MPTSWVHSFFSRRGLLGLVVVLVTAVAVAVVSAEPAGGQATLECDGGLYITTGSPDDMTLTRVDQETGELTEVGGGGLVANALGHNPQDDYLYGMDRDDPHHVVRVSADGNEDDLGAAVGAPTSWELTFVGTFLENGHYLVLGDNTPAQTPRGTVPSTWAEIDVNQSPPQVLRTFSHPSIGNNDLQDVALDPVSGDLFGHSITRHRIVRIDTTTGAATAVGPTFSSPANAGSSFFDSFGRMWLYGSDDTVGTQDTLYRIDEVGEDTPVVVAEGPAVTNSDGASCPFSLGMEKTVTPAAACAGTDVTYRYALTNEAVPPHPRSRPTEEANVVQATFTDELPDDGRTFVASTLVNPFGGHVEPYGGTRRLRIDDLRIPHEEPGTIQVQVALPADMDPGTVLNQAVLSEPSANVGLRILSEYPGTPQLPDPTPLIVQTCADLGIEKTADTVVAGPGDPVHYTLRVTNHGPSDADDVDSVADSLPDGLTFVSASDGGTLTADGTVRWPAFDLAAGAHRDLTVSATADADVRTAAGDDGDLDNTASVQHPGDPNDSNDRDTAEVPVDHPDLVVDKDDGLEMVNPGDEVTYTITVHNAGEGDADGVVLTDELPEELEFMDGTEQPRYREPATVTWPAFDLAAGEERSVTVTARVDEGVPAGSDVLNVAEAPHPDDPNPEDNRDDDLDGVDRPVDRVDDPAPTDDPPAPWLPRTGLEVASWTAIGIGLSALGLAVRWWSQTKLRP